MAVEGGRTRGVHMSYMSWGSHIISEKTYAPNGVDAVLETPEWRRRQDEVWHAFYRSSKEAFYGPPAFDLDKIQQKRAEITARRPGSLGQVLVAEQVLHANATNGSWESHASMLGRAAQLAAAGQLRVLRNAVDRTVIHPYPFSIFTFDGEFGAHIGSNKAVILEGKDGAALYPTGAGNPYNDELLRDCEAGFSHTWMLSGIDLAYGATRHLGRDASQLEPADETLVRDRTVAYIEECAATGGWG